MPLPAAAIMMPFPCSTDHAAFGLMDPTHAAYVHTSWWFKHQARKLRPKEKPFEPSELGWRMVRHRSRRRTSSTSCSGSNVATEITYRLPGLRIEEVRGDQHAVVGLTAITPITDEATEVHQMFWTTPGWVGLLAPLIRPFMRTFLDQDRRVVVRQREGLVHEPQVMLINDADTQARWWMRVKDEWIAAQAEQRPFDNPLEAEDAALEELRQRDHVRPFAPRSRTPRPHRSRRRRGGARGGARRRARQEGRGLRAAQGPRRDDAGGAPGEGAAAQRPQGSRQRGDRARRDVLKEAALDGASRPSAVDVTLPVRAARSRPAASTRSAR